jgi:hypothetical protein
MDGASATRYDGSEERRAKVPKVLIGSEEGSGALLGSFEK